VTIGQLSRIELLRLPTATFRVLYVFSIMAHDRRTILQFNVATSPSADWTARQVLEAFPYHTRPPFLLDDRDTIFAGDVVRRVGAMGIADVARPGRDPRPAFEAFAFADVHAVEDLEPGMTLPGIVTPNLLSP